ncbi:ribonuclease toxin immunity protein CdiI [Vallitalea guaymasensis]|uniref:CDI immunity protein domain-containing protein n=1 Tax=Vallitalea guaymasensis TaxID=1185412 RepID=A0A8J8SBS9_9FIRM|nr:ribonuclease toxin immunity protein CdiI [Vallitalea guaymasensis]QUH29093.1 hypothetical protein HYG85_09225 [Vallitalea guaymasensis]
MEVNKYYSYFPQIKENFVLIDFFYFMSKSDFVKVIGYISERTGYSDGIKGIFFSNSFEIWDEEYFESGVMVYVNEKEVIVDNKVFQNYLRIAIDLFLDRYDGDKNTIRVLGEKISKMSFD